MRARSAVAAANLDALYTFLTDAVGPLEAAVTAIDTTSLLATVKRTGLTRERRGPCRVLSVPARPVDTASCGQTGRS